MATTTLVPLDESTEVCPESWLSAGEAFSGIPDPTDPGPGDPGTPLVPYVASSLGRRVQVLICAPVTHRPICELRTAKNVEWTDRFGVGDASFTVDTHDPALRLFPTRTTTVRGRTVADPDLKGVEVLIGLDGVAMFPGIIQDPTGWADGRIAVKVKSPEALWDERTLGETEQHDYYEGRGAFPTTDLTGWEFSANITHSWNTSDPYEGDRSLTIEAADIGAWSYAPWVLMPGQDGFSRYPVASALTKTAEGKQVTVGVFIEKMDGTEVNADFTKDSYASSDDGTTTWQGPVAGRGRLLPEAVDQRVRAGIFIPRNTPVSIDLLRLQWPTLTGYPNEQDLSRYPVRIIRDAEHGPGGSQWGFSSTIAGLTGIEEKITFPHQDDHPVGEAISTITDMDGGPDVRVTPGWRVIVEPRRGQDRRDIALTPDRIIDCTMTIDPGGQVDELRALTDIGNASYRHVFGVDAPVAGRRRRIRQLTQVPNGLSYDAARRWTEGQAKFAARTPFSATVTVDLTYGLRFAVGDGVLFAYDDGNLAWWGPVRVGARSVKASVNQCVLEIGSDPVVDL